MLRLHSSRVESIWRQFVCLVGSSSVKVRFGEAAEPTD